jgi:hypothetical protein
MCDVMEECGFDGGKKSRGRWLWSNIGEQILVVKEGVTLLVE